MFCFLCMLLYAMVSFMHYFVTAKIRLRMRKNFSEVRYTQRPMKLNHSIFLQGSLLFVKVESSSPQLPFPAL